jgi:hypothetical protein
MVGRPGIEYEGVLESLTFSPSVWSLLKSR